MTACEWSLFLNALAISIAKNKSAEDLAFLSLLFEQLSSTLAFLTVSPPGCNTPASGRGSATESEALLAR